MPIYFAEPLRGSDLNTFAHETVAVRMPAIGRRTLAEGLAADIFTPQAAESLAALVDELPHGRIRLLEDALAPDWEEWNTHIRPYEGQTWLDAPWFFVETYYYRRLVEASGYFMPGLGKNSDPFRPQKLLALAEARQALENCAGCLEQASGPHGLDVEELFRLALWGNQADLSMWPAGSANRPAQGGGARLLVDDASAAAAHLERVRGGRVDLVLDNTGAELAFDLLLADGLLRRRAAGAVRLWVKLHPTFVSDATIPDIPETLSALAASASPPVHELARRLLDSLQSGQLQIATHPFWTSPLPGWGMPADLRAELQKSALLVSKGDANYRRWLGDRHWPAELPLEDVLDYLPAPNLLLRVLKSEVVIGLRPGQVESAFQQDTRWMVNGHWGLVQFAGH